MAVVTAGRLRELLDYDAETGVFKWRVKRKKVNPGDVAGRFSRYLAIGIDGKCYLAHRLAWFYVHGCWPKEYVDHINGDPSDNRLANLRECTPRQNTHNRRGDRKTKSGIKGVYPRRNGRAWEASIMNAGVLRYLGQFQTPELAEAAYRAAAVNLHGKFAYGA